MAKTASDAQSDVKIEKAEDDASALPGHEKSTIPDVEVITRHDLDTQGFAAALKDSEKESLLKGEIVIRDHRTNTSKVYRAEGGKTVTTPTTTGVYKMLTRGGRDLQDILVIYAPLTIGAGQTNCVTVVDLEDRYAANTDPKLIQVTENLTGPGDWSRYVDKLTGSKEMSEGSWYCLISPMGKGTIPFKVLHKRSNPDDTTEFWVVDNDNIERFGNYGLGG
jgi:hypothetical protein